MRQWQKKLVENDEGKRRTGQWVQGLRIQQCVGEWKEREGESDQERQYE